MTHTINVPLARRILAQIMAAPARWRQGVWLDRPYAPQQQGPEDTVDNCKTSGCFAGWAVVLSGVRTDQHNRPVEVPPIAETWLREHYGWDDTIYADDVSVAATAAAYLGLNPGQKADLFSGSNTLRELYEYLERWTEGEIAVPDELPEWADMTTNALEEFFAPDEDDEDADA